MSSIQPTSFIIRERTSSAILLRACEFLFRRRDRFAICDGCRGPERNEWLIDSVELNCAWIIRST